MKTIFIAPIDSIINAKVYFKGDIVVRWLKDKFVAHYRFCPHQNADLGIASVCEESFNLKCPIHPIKFCLESGKGSVQKWALKMYHVLLENGNLFIQINENEAINL